MTPENPVVGGSILRRPAIQSPNFEQGPPIVGWAINADGTAYFGDVTAEGTITASSFTGTDFLINSSGIFVYSGTPASGNLIGSIAASGGTDGFGNTYVGGITTYDPSTGRYVEMAGEFLNFFSTGMFQTQQLLAAGNAEFQVSSGLQSSGDISANITLESADAAGGSSTIVLSAAVVDVIDKLSVGGGSMPTTAPTITTLPPDSNSGSTWVSGERAFMNNSWVTPINNNFNAIVNALAAAGIWP
jgi:hypothetical protein